MILAVTFVPFLIGILSRKWSCVASLTKGATVGGYSLIDSFWQFYKYFIYLSFS